MKHQSNILALKYRPSNFQDLIGQEYLVETIQKSIKQNKIPNAYIFTGIRGVGKTTTARIVAKMLNCTVFDKNNNPDLTNCEQAKAITEDRHPDVIEIDAASNTSVENAREIIENVKYNPVLGKYKVYIVDEVHMLSKSAFNASSKHLKNLPLIQNLYLQLLRYLKYQLQFYRGVKDLIYDVLIRRRYAIFL